MAKKRKGGTNWRIAGGVFVTEAIVTSDGLIIEGQLNAERKPHRHGDVALRLLMDLSCVSDRSLAPRQRTAIRRQLRVLASAAREAIDTKD